MAKKGGGPDWLDDEDIFGDSKDDILAEDVSEDDAAAEGAPMLSRGGTGRSATRGAEEDEPDDRAESRRESRRDDSAPGRGHGEETDDDDVDKKPSLAARMAMKHAKRPGEQESLKSPLVLGLGGGGLGVGSQRAARARGPRARPPLWRRPCNRQTSVDDA